MGYFVSDGQRGSSFDGQHQQNLMSSTPGVLQYDKSFNDNNQFFQHPSLASPFQSSFSELENALLEIPSHNFQCIAPSLQQAPAIPLLNTATSLSLAPQSVKVPKYKVGQGILKMPSSKQSVLRKPAMACLFCHEHKIACGTRAAGNANTTCKYVILINSDCQNY